MVKRDPGIYQKVLWALDKPVSHSYLQIRNKGVLKARPPTTAKVFLIQSQHLLHCNFSSFDKRKRSQGGWMEACGRDPTSLEPAGSTTPKATCCSGNVLKFESTANPTSSALCLGRLTEEAHWAHIPVASQEGPPRQCSLQQQESKTLQWVPGPHLLRYRLAELSGRDFCVQPPQDPTNPREPQYTPIV